MTMQNVFEFKDVEFTPDPVYKYNRKGLKDACIVIDNGSHTCRAGWSIDNKPRLEFRNLIAKYRGKKESDASSNYYFGNDIRELEDVKWNIRTQFDMDVVTHFDTQECSLDYIFSHLGIDTDRRVQHPVCITEAVCIPNTFRQCMSEVLFECYSVPRIVYGIDALYSFHYNHPAVDFGLIVRTGYQTTHVLPIVNGKFDPSACRRLNLGGLNMMIYLRRLLQLKYPSHTSLLNLSRAQELLVGHTYMAENYHDELLRWKDKSFHEKYTLRIQLPVINTSTEKDLELRKLQAKRLKEINQRKREEKIKKEGEQLVKLQNIQELENSNPTAFKAQMKSEGLRSENDLCQVIDELKEKIASRKAKSVLYYKELSSDDQDDFYVGDTTVEEVEKLVASLEEEKLALIDKRRSRASRKQALNKRKSYASKERMRILSQLAKVGKLNEKSNKEDTFGMKDEDWDVYKFINKDGSESEEEQEQERLNEIEQSLSQYQLLINRLMIGRGQKYQYASYNTEHIRIPELLYQPSMAGLEQEGLIGMIGYVLKNYDEETRDRLVKNVFVMGGLSQLPGFKERLEHELMAILPFQTKFNVTQAKNSLLDSWLGAADFVRDCNNFKNISIDAKDYEEQGVGYIKEHKCSNLYFPLQE